MVTPTNEPRVGYARDDQPGLFPVDDALARVTLHAWSSRRALTDAQKRDLIRRIQRRRIATGWVR